MSFKLLEMALNFLDATFWILQESTNIGFHCPLTTTNEETNELLLRAKL